MGTLRARGPVRVRIGLHTGAPTVTAEGYVGVDVHRGARIAALAHGGQTIVSPATAALLDGEVMVDLGAHRLKDFDGATRLHQLGTGEFPPVRTPGSVELPTPATRFVGRERELHDAVSLVLERDPRLLTVLGPGGTGKTRFAIELARLLAEEAPGGTVFVPVAPLRDAELILPAVAQALGAGEPTVDSVATALRARRTHVLIDNLEHLLPATASAVVELIEGAPELRLLATSREALRIHGEERFDLPPLVEAEAVELFLTRARAVRADIETSPAVYELCHRLDHLPLPIELAAARANLLSPEALLERLSGALDLLRGTRDADPRHATLRATIAWSYDLLAPAEQALFARLSVFAAGCTLESAERVCDADLAELESLLDKSLVRRRTGMLGEDRFWMLETIREFAAERLHESGEANEMRRRHTERMLEIARSAHLSAETSGHGREAQRHELVLAERDDVRAGLDWAAEHDVPLALELALALENFWAAHSPKEGAGRVAALLERAGPRPAAQEARALRVHGATLYRSGDYEAGVRRYEQSLAAFRALGDVYGEASVLGRLAVHAGNVGDAARARSLGEHALALARDLDLPRLEAQALATLAAAHRADGELEAAWELPRRSAHVATESGFRWWQALQLVEQLELGLELGRLDEAENAGRGALRLAAAIEDRIVTLWALAGLAQVERERGQLERSGKLWGAAAAEHEREPLSADSQFREFAHPLASASEPAFVAGAERGSAMTLLEAVALALGEDQTSP